MADEPKRETTPMPTKENWEFVKNVPDNELRWAKVRDGWWLHQDGDMFNEKDADFVEEILHGEPFLAGVEEGEIEGIIIKVRRRDK